MRDLIDGSPAWLSGGFGLDTLLGYPSRDHGDIDVSITEDDFPGFVATLPSWMQLHAAQSGQLAPIDDADETEPLDNVWCLDTRSGSWCLQINREAGDSDGWRYRRVPSIRRAWPLAVREVGGMRVVGPEVQLLWKAADPVLKDEADKSAVTPLLDDEARRWLRDSIRRAHPGSPWSDEFD
ncbi:nucleotidyltransferase domain-containing protein [Microbacterium sp. M1A1_1b]